MTTATLDDLIAAHPALGEHAILHAYRGSIAHGMYVPGTDPNSIDDVDTMAFCVPPLDYYVGTMTFGSRGTHEIKQGEYDVVAYEARKAIGLLAKGNPNVLTMLWLPRSAYLTLRPTGEYLRQHRDLFRTQSVGASFVGYAYDQMTKMERGVFSGYMGERRRALVEQYGYDTKNAAHLIRLLRMGAEFLRDGDLIVDRREAGDADELLAIKRGEWNLEQVKDEAERGFAEAQRLRNISTLPERVEPDVLNYLTRRVVLDTLEMRGER